VSPPTSEYEFVNAQLKNVHKWLDKQQQGDNQSEGSSLALSDGDEPVAHLVVENLFEHILLMHKKLQIIHLGQMFILVKIVKKLFRLIFHHKI
jgi:hypothetical protein